MGERRIDKLEAEAEAIGRRSAIKLAHRFGAEATAAGLPDFFDTVATFVEAEVRSATGTPVGGDVVMRLTYAEAVQAVTAVVEVMAEDRSASEAETLADLKRKFFLALGIAPSCRMSEPNARSA